MFVSVFIMFCCATLISSRFQFTSVNLSSHDFLKTTRFSQIILSSLNCLLSHLLKINRWRYYLCFSEKLFSPLLKIEKKLYRNMSETVDLRKWGEDHINRSIKQVNDHTWLMGNFALRRFTTDYDAAAVTWIDSVDKSAWFLRENPNDSLPVASVPSSSSFSSSSNTRVDSAYIKLIHEAGDFSAVWAIGNDVICKTRFREANVTAESVTLEYVSKNRKPSSSFDVPEVLRQVFVDDRYFLLVRRLPGRTLDTAWPSLDERWKSHYVSSIVNACIEMATWRGLEVGGIDGQLIPEYFLASPNGDFSLVRGRCEALSTDYLNPVFYHADLGPTNIIVEDEPISGKVGIIDFECAGFFPKEWIRTKFRVCSGLDLIVSGDDGSATQWRWRMQKALEAAGFKDCLQAYIKQRHGISKPVKP